MDILTGIQRNKGITMKLFIWEGKNIGCSTIYVIEETEERAKTKADEYVAKQKKEGWTWFGWGTDFYELRTAEVGEIVEQFGD